MSAALGQDSLLLAGSLLALIAGLVAGVVFFGSLARVVRHWLTPGGSRGHALLLQVARHALLLALLVPAVLAGALPLLCATLGLLAGRALVLRRVRY